MANDVRVRLSAEGQAEVVDAFRKVQAEADRSARTGGRSFNNLNGVLSKTRGLLLGLGVSVSVGAFVGLARSAADYADTLSEAAESTGTTTRHLTALAASARLGGVDLDGLRTAFSKFNNQLDDLRQGGPGASAVFDRLGISAAELREKSPAEALELVAQRLERVQDPAARSAIAVDLLGKSGARLIPTLRSLARDGLEGTADQMARLGLVMDDQVIDAASRASDQLGVMGLQAKSLATQFVAGMAPDIDAAFRAISGSLAEGQETWKLFGHGVGVSLNIVIGLVSFLVDTAVTGMLIVSSTIVDSLYLVANAVAFNWSEVKRISTGSIRWLEQTTKAYFARQGRLFSEMAKSQSAPAKTPVMLIDREAQARADAAARQRAATLLRSSRDQELKSVELANRLLLQAEQRRYDRGLSSVVDYFTARRRVVEENLRAELKALEARRLEAAMTAEPGKRQAAVAAVDADAQRARMEAEAELVALTHEQQAEQDKLGLARLAFEDKVRQAQGQSHEIRMREIQEELAGYAQVLAQQGVPDQAVIGKVNEFKQALEAALAFEERMDELDAGLRDLAAERARIEAEALAGQVSELEAKREILNLERERLPVLQQIAAGAAAAAGASGDPAKLTAAREAAQGLETLGAAASESQLRLANLRSEVGDRLEPILADFLSGGEAGFRNFGQLVSDTVLSIIQSLRRLGAEIAASKLMEALGFKFAGGGPTSSAPIAGHAAGGPLRASMGAVLDVRGGGRLFGPGTTTSDSILGRFSHREFVVRAAVVDQPGVEDHLRRLNAGMGRQEIRRFWASRPAFAEGGLTLAQPSEAKLSGSVTLGLEEGLVARQLASPEALRSLLRVVNRNRRAFGRALQS